MNVSELFRGVAVVIDDEVYKDVPGLTDILKQIDSQHIHMLKFDAIPSNGKIDGFRNISFVLLDWRLSGASNDLTLEGVTLPEGIQEDQYKENVEFLKRFKKVCLCPVFIFTNDAPETVLGRLESENLIIPGKPSHIFVKAKVDLREEGQLFAEIERWLERTPSIYVLKKWEAEYNRSKNDLFTDFYHLSPDWPRVMWQTFGDDGVDPSIELGELITRNLETRMSPFNFSEDVLSNQDAQDMDKDELVAVLEGERFVKAAALSEEVISTGDIFVCEDKRTYYLNLRAACDLVARNCPSDDIELYLLEGRSLKLKKAKDLYNEKYGNFEERINQAIVFPLNSGNCVCFDLKKFSVKLWKEMKEYRVGRLLPPHVDRVQKRHGAFMQRQGLPRTPKKALGIE